VNALAAIHKEKTLAHMSAGAEIEKLAISACGETAADLRRVIGDVMDGARVLNYSLEENPGVPSGAFAVKDVVFLKKDRET